MGLPKQGEEYIFEESLDDVETSDFLADPTIVAGDFQISKDGGAYVNLATLPTVQEAGKSPVTFTVTAAEATVNDRVKIIGRDSAGLWGNVDFSIEFPTGNIDTVNDLLEGDRTESSANVTILKKGTSTEILNKDITGSLLSTSITVRTTENS